MNTPENIDQDKPAAPPQMSAEQAADLAALQAAADNEAPLPGAPEPVAVPNLAEELEGLTLGVVAILKPVFPSLSEIYTPDATKLAAGGVAAVCNKHGWMQGGMMGKWGEEIACAIVVGPLLVATVKGVRGDLAKMEAAKPKAIETTSGPDLSAKAPTQQVGQKTVTFGAAVPA